MKFVNFSCSKLCQTVGYNIVFAFHGNIPHPAESLYDKLNLPKAELGSFVKHAQVCNALLKASIQKQIEFKRKN